MKQTGDIGAPGLNSSVGLPAASVLGALLTVASLLVQPVGAARPPPPGPSPGSGRHAHVVVQGRPVHGRVIRRVPGVAPAAASHAGHGCGGRSVGWVGACGRSESDAA